MYELRVDRKSVLLSHAIIFILCFFLVMFGIAINSFVGVVFSLIFLIVPFYRVYPYFRYPLLEINGDKVTFINSNRKLVSFNNIADVHVIVDEKYITIHNDYEERNFIEWQGLITPDQWKQFVRDLKNHNFGLFKSNI